MSEEASDPKSPDDQLNRHIILMLQEDGRRSYAEIARELGVSQGTIRNRVSLLREQGILQIIAAADPRALGYTAFAMVGVNVAPGVDPGDVAEQFQQLPEATYVLFCGGRYDLMVEVICKDNDAFQNFLTENFYRNSKISKIETFMGFKMYKNWLRWG